MTLPNGSVAHEGADVVVTGHITTINRHLLKQAVIDAIAVVRAAGDPVRLDLSGVFTLDSSAIGALVSAAKHASAADVEVIVRGASPDYRDVLTRLIDTAAGVSFTFAEDIPE